MKGTIRDRGGAVVVTMALAVFLVTVSAADLALAAELPPGLRKKVVEELSDRRARDQVLDNLSRALDGGLSPDTLTLFVDRAMESGVSQPTLEHLTGTLARALEDKLPSGPIVAKVLEGVAKGVTEDRLVKAVDTVLERLQFAADVARMADSRDDDRDAFIVRTADAVAAGMDRNRIRSLAAQMAERKKSSPVSSLQVMELVKTASGYGVEQEKIERVARALIDDEKADEEDVRRILRSLVEHDGGDGGRGDSQEDAEDDDDSDDSDDDGDGDGGDDGGDDDGGGDGDDSDGGDDPGDEPEDG